jgi:tetratricopeptide (TPR) repeat protein
MKKIYRHTIKFVLITCMVMVLGSCKKSFLEILPKGKIIATKTADYDFLLNNLDLINSTTDAQAYLGDEVAATEPNWTGAGFRDKQLFKYEGDLYTVEADANETLVPLRTLYIYNKVINEVMATEGTEVTKKTLQAEALTGRAWVNFLMVNYFGKPYNAATAATDPGFPLITEADINRKSFERVSVQKVYDLIISDLTTAIPNLVNTGVTWRTRLSKAAAKGILARVYMSMGKFAEAQPLLDDAINSLPQSTVALGTSLYNYRTAFPGFPTAVNDMENVFAKNFSNFGVVSTTKLFALTAEASALFDPADLRLATTNFTSTTYPNGVKLLKKIGGATICIGVRVPDLYLMRAEVRARLGDLTGAVTDVVFLRQNRLPAGKEGVPPTASVSKVPLIQFILEERIREFAMQGYRWFDMRRLSVDPLFSSTTYQHKVYNAAGDVSETFTLKPERFVLKFSPKIMAENAELINNP